MLCAIILLNLNQTSNVEVVCDGHGRTDEGHDNITKPKSKINQYTFYNEKKIPGGSVSSLIFNVGWQTLS